MRKTTKVLEKKRLKAHVLPVEGTTLEGYF